MEYGWLSILPPVLAIILSLLTGEVLLSLFLAIIVGATIVAGNPLLGFTSTLNKYIVGSLTDEWNISILIFMNLHALVRIHCEIIYNLSFLATNAKTYLRSM